MPGSLAGRSTEVDLYTKAWVQSPHRSRSTCSPSTRPLSSRPRSGTPAWHRSRSTRSSNGSRRRRRTVGCPPSWWGSTSRPSPMPGSSPPARPRSRSPRWRRCRRFPGMRRGSPAMFVAASALEDLGLSTPVREVRIRGERTDDPAHARRGGDELRGGHDRHSVVDAVSFLTVSQTFGFMRSLGGGVRAARASGVSPCTSTPAAGAGCSPLRSLRRMGLTRRQHRRALAGRGAGGRRGRAAGWGWSSRWSAPGSRTSGSTRSRSFQPDPLLRPATGVLVGLGLAALVVAVVAATIAQRVDRS